MVEEEWAKRSKRHMNCLKKTFDIFISNHCKFCFGMPILGTGNSFWFDFILFGLRKPRHPNSPICWNENDFFPFFLVLNACRKSLFATWGNRLAHEKSINCPNEGFYESKNVEKLVWCIECVLFNGDYQYLWSVFEPKRCSQTISGSFFPSSQINLATEIFLWYLLKFALS